MEPKSQPVATAFMELVHAVSTQYREGAIMAVEGVNKLIAVYLEKQPEMNAEQEQFGREMDAIAAMNTAELVRYGKTFEFTDGRGGEWWRRQDGTSELIVKDTVVETYTPGHGRPGVSKRIHARS